MYTHTYIYIYDKRTLLRRTMPPPPSLSCNTTFETKINNVRKSLWSKETAILQPTKDTDVFSRVQSSWGCTRHTDEKYPRPS